MVSMYADSAEKSCLSCGNFVNSIAGFAAEFVQMIVAVNYRQRRVDALEHIAVNAAVVLQICDIACANRCHFKMFFLLQEFCSFLFCSDSLFEKMNEIA